jgi:uncharacterized protein YaaR (DUF327 family)
MARDTYKENLKEHIKKILKKGYTPDTIKYALIKQGYSRVLVERAIDESQKEIAKEVASQEKPKIKYEVFDEKSINIEKKPWWKFW